MHSKAMPSWVGDGIMGKWHRLVSSSESVLQLSEIYLFLSGSGSVLLKLKMCSCPECVPVRNRKQAQPRTWASRGGPSQLLVCRLDPAQDRAFGATVPCRMRSPDRGGISDSKTVSEACYASFLRG